MNHKEKRYPRSDPRTIESHTGSRWGVNAKGAKPDAPRQDGAAGRVEDVPAVVEVAELPDSQLHHGLDDEKDAKEMLRGQIPSTDNVLSSR